MTKVKLLGVATILTLSAMVQAGQASEVDATLDTLHAAGEKLKTMAADVELTTTDRGTGDFRVERGRIVLERLADGDSRARITFNERVVGEKLMKVRRDFLLEQGTLVEQNEEKKTQVTRQQRRPGEKVDLFKLGQGPFPLPIGQTKESVHEQFDVEAGKEKNIVLLTPKKDTALFDKFKSITVTVDEKLGVPTTIATIDKRGVEKRSVVLKNVRMNENVSADEFKLPPIDPKTWRQVSE